MGLNRKDFYDLTPIDFNYAYEKFLEEKENDLQIQYNIMRLQTFYLVNIQLASESRLRDLRELMHFEWDDPITIDESMIVTPEELLETQKELSRVLFNKN